MNRQSFILLLLLCAAAFWGCEKSADTTIDNPTSANSSYPYLYSSDNALYMSWLSKDTSETFTLQYASYADDQWSSPKPIAHSSDWFINWADFPSVIADESGPVAAHWLNKKSGGPYAYDVNVSIADSAENWQPAFAPHNDSTATEHGFVSMIPWDANSFLAVWLDGRLTADRADDEYYDLSKAMTLRGALISKDGQLQQEFLIDESVCDCCNTSLAKTSEGAVVAYRNRTGEEVRDIYVSRFNGKEWSQPEAIYNDKWHIGGCPVNGPKIASADSTVAIAWHTGANDDPTTKVVLSSDNGRTFGEPIRLSKNRSLGRTDAAIHNDYLYISWMESGKKDQSKLQLATINIGDKTNQTETISMIDGARKTGFPQMEIFDGQLFFAWTNTDSDQTSITIKKKNPPLLTGD